MFEAFCEDIRLDKWNFDERYGKSFYEAIENFIKPQFPSGNIDPRKVFETCYMFCNELSDGSRPGHRASGTRSKFPNLNENGQKFHFFARFF